MTRRKINLALQGGGAHGAFTWGALDRLLEDGRFEIEGLTGTSAGAMNAVALAAGLAEGGPEGARAALRRFWEAIGRLPGLADLVVPGVFQQREWNLDSSPFYIWFDLMGRLFSPYDLPLSSTHPLEAVLEQTIDFAALRRPNSPVVVVCATSVRNGRPRFFDNEDIGPQALLASTCLPFLFRAVEIDGEPYWDGGYVGNPPFYPLLRRTTCNDYVLVAINPTRRDEAPRTAREIIDRVNEISFNSALMGELRTAALLQHLVKTGMLNEAAFRPFRMHAIDAEAILSKLGASSKLNNSLAFLQHLFAVGRDATDRWLAEKSDLVGSEQTLDIAATYLGMDRFNDNLPGRG